MPFLPHPDTRNLVFPSATGTLGYNNSTGWINNLPILSLHSRQVSADVQRSQLDEWGAIDLLTSARFSLCALFYEHSPITESSLQFAAYLLCTYLRLVLDMIFSPPLTLLPLVSCFKCCRAVSSLFRAVDHLLFFRFHIPGFRSFPKLSLADLFFFKHRGHTMGIVCLYIKLAEVSFLHASTPNPP